MTLTELKYVLTLAQEKHFGKAAKRCHVSQPTLSMAISKLEAELNVLIFERDKNSIRVTEVGELIIEHAQRILDEVQVLKEIAHNNHSQLTRPLRVGAIFTIGPHLFPNLIPALKKLAPQMPLIIQEDYTANLRVKLLQGELDAIFVSLPFSENGIVTQALYDEPFVVVMPHDHSLAKKKAIHLDELKDEELLLLGKGHCFRQQVIEVCPHCYNKESSAQKTIEGTSIDTLLQMVASGLGITVLPRTATQTDCYRTMLVTKPFADTTPQRTIALAWRVSFTRPKAIGALIEALQHSSMKGICLLR